VKGGGQVNETLVGGGITAGLAVVGWVLHLGNRVTKLETLQEATHARLTEIRDDVKGIDGKLDAVILRNKK
jgi:hypothetical protein